MLIHCQAGRSRSPATVMAYLLHSRRCHSLEEAFMRVRAARSMTNPNWNFLRQLYIYNGQTEEDRAFLVSRWAAQNNVDMRVDDPRHIAMAWSSLEDCDWDTKDAAVNFRFRRSAQRSQSIPQTEMPMKRGTAP